MTNARLQAHMRAAMRTICPTEDELLEFGDGRLRQTVWSRSASMPMRGAASR